VTIPKFLKTGDSHDISYQFVKKNGEIVDIMLSAIAERNEGGEFVRSLAILTDVTERKRVEKVLQKTRDELEKKVRDRTTELSKANVQLKKEVEKRKQAEAIKDDFISTATHELRTPLTALQGYSSMLMKELVNLEEKPRTYLDRIERTTNRLHRIVENLLNVLRMENGPKVELSPFSIHGIIEEAVTEFELKAELESKHLSFLIKKNFIVLGNKEYTKKILYNLLENALKYTESGDKILITCKEDLSTSDWKLIASVADTGIGISKKYSEKIFNKFYRVWNDPPVKAAGSGLGLYIAKQLVAMQGGKIWFQSQPGRGSKFSFSLPLVEQSEQLTLVGPNP